MHIYDKIVSKRNNRPCYKHRVNLFNAMQKYGVDIGKNWESWTDRELFQFVHEWDSEFKFKPKTVKKRFDDLRQVSRGAIWHTQLQEDEKSFSELVNLYLRYRSENTKQIFCTKQAQEISLQTARAVNGFLLGKSESEPWKQQLNIARILALSFSFVGGCRVGDLQHIKWGRIFEGTLEGKPAIYAVLVWSKTNMYGLNENDYRIFPEYKYKVLCPVTLWQLYKDKLPNNKKATGPFISLRSGKSFATDVIIRGWKQAAEELQFSTEFSAHSCRRTRITEMRNMGMSDIAIRKILGYAENSAMPAHYDIKKRVGNKAAIEGEIRRYTSQLIQKA